MSTATSRRNKNRTLTVGLRFDINREQMARAISAGLYWRPSWKRVQYTGDFPVHRGREGILTFVRALVKKHGVWGMKWTDDADQSKAVKRRAYELADMYFPDLKAP